MCPVLQCFTARAGQPTRRHATPVRVATPGLDEIWGELGAYCHPPVTGQILDDLGSVGISARAFRVSPRETRHAQDGRRHLVVDIERWLQGKAERAAILGQYATNVMDHVAADGSNNVAVTADIHDMAGLQALMDSPSPEDAAAEERHGVIQPFSVYIEK